MASQFQSMREPPAVKNSVLRERVLSVLVYAALLVYLVYPYSDYDWGWHYRYGEYLLTHGTVLRHDIFSWTMPGYEWVHHSWLYDPLVYVLTNSISFLGLALAGAVAGLLTFLASIRRAHLLYWQTAVLAVFFAALSQEALLQGLRGQVLGLLLFSILVDLLCREREGQTWSHWALPCLFCVWANVHGSFLVGLMVFGTYVGCDFVILKSRAAALPRHWFVFAGSFLVSVAMTLVNPFTYGVYVEAARQMGSPMLPYVVEWTRPNFSEVIGMLFLAYVALLAWGFFTRRKLDDLPWFVVASVTFYLGVTSRRHVPVFMVLTLPFAASVVKDLRFRVEGVARTSLAVVVMVAVFGIAVFERRAEMLDLWRNPSAAYCTYGPRCSEGLTQFLLRQPPIGHGFNHYDWGGYMIGMGVKTKLFIDGRMHVWERDDFRPMEDYRAIYSKYDLEAFDRYQFDWFIVPRRSNFAKELAKYRSPTTGVKQDDLWAIAYQDERALYAVRKKGGN